MSKIKNLEEKVNQISEDIGIDCWKKEKIKDSGSPPTFCEKRTFNKACYNNLSPKEAIKLILEYLGLEIKKSSEIYPPFVITKKK